MERIAAIQLDVDQTELRATRLFHRLDAGPSPLFRPFRLTNFNLTYLISGSLFRIRAGKRIEIKTDDMEFGFPGDEISGWSDCQTSMYHCHFNFGSAPVQIISSSLGEWASLTAKAGELSRHTEALLCLPDKIHIRHQDRVAELFTAMLDDQESRMPGARLAFQAHLMLLLRHVSAETMAELLKQDRPAGRNKAHIHVNRALHDIETHLSNTVSIHGLAEKLRLNPDYLGRVFRQTLGMNIGEYILRRRMAKARDLLLSANMNVKEIAAKVGFKDPLYFSRMFRKQTGMSPSEYILRNTNLSGFEGRLK